MDKPGVQLKKIVRAHYVKKGRRTLPWRKPQTPYRVLVSEYMLQQTQVERVIPKFNAFVKRYPNFKSLSSASLPEVFSLWQGLGYNRRAKYLRDAAIKITKEKKGLVPNDRNYLRTLPGIGPYTAGAILAFSFGTPEPFIETNIRTVVLHHCFPKQKKVSDEKILSVLTTLIPKKGAEAKRWYAALMDYGSFLKMSGVKLNAKSTHYTKQTTFKGSRRQLRGALMRELLSGPQSLTQLKKKTKRDPQEIREEIAKLTIEGLLKQQKGLYQLSD